MDERLDHLDRQVQPYATELAAIGVHEPAVPTHVYTEICSLPADARTRIRNGMSLAPERYADELSAFQAFEEIVYANGRGGGYLHQ